MVGGIGLQSSYACSEKDRGTLLWTVMQVSTDCSGTFRQKGRGRTCGGALTCQKCILCDASFMTGNCRFVDTTVHFLSTMVTIDDRSRRWTSRHACLSAKRQISLQLFPADIHPCLKPAKTLSRQIGATKCWRLAVPFRKACGVFARNCMQRWLALASHLCVGQSARL
jgi:hypothetical protein